MNSIVILQQPAQLNLYFIFSNISLAVASFRAVAGARWFSDRDLSRELPDLSIFSLQMLKCISEHPELTEIRRANMTAIAAEYSPYTGSLDLGHLTQSVTGDSLIVLLLHIRITKTPLSTNSSAHV